MNASRNWQNFIQKVMAVIDNPPPSKSKRIKGTSQDWFNSEIMEIINRGISFSKNSKNFTCMLMKILITNHGMRYKNETLERKNLTLNVNWLKILNRKFIGKPKKLWKSLKSLGLKFERSISNINYLENDKYSNFDVNNIAEEFRAYFSNLEENLEKIHNP